MSQRPVVARQWAVGNDGRMPTKQGADRRSVIVHAAGQLFLARGFAGVSMDDVLHAVGGSKSTLYRHFADKVELFQSCVEALLDEKAAPLREFVPTDPDLTVTLTAFGRYFAGVVLDPVSIALHRLVTAEAERIPGLGRAFFEHGPAFGQQVLGQYLQVAADSGVIRVVDARAASAQLYQAMLGDIQMRLLTNSPSRPTPDEVEQSIVTAVDVFLNGALVR
ncbi:TetR/AcrR family transcriptional regulator [Cryptosporangium sp. NPDC048952]|uniref:TetR/AcrR family transcriptional regulator n=1 Tax=Cryptosporangium sp. NPDC048952 TaxID=3363961 RepID=UPI00371B0EFA